MESRFVFAPSRLAAALLAAGAGMALCSVFLMPLPLAACGVLAAALAAAFWRAHWQLAALRGARAVHGLEFRADQALAVLDQNGEVIAIGALARCHVSPYLTTIIVRAGRRRYRALVLPDSLSPRAFRHLRIRLKGQMARLRGGGA